MLRKGPLSIALRWTLAVTMLLAAGLLRAELPGCGQNLCDQTCPMHRPVEEAKSCCPEKAPPPPEPCQCGIKSAPPSDVTLSPALWLPTLSLLAMPPPALPALVVLLPEPPAEIWPSVLSPPGKRSLSAHLQRGPPAAALLVP